jgi:hypothetical protein
MSKCINNRNCNRFVIVELSTRQSLTFSLSMGFSDSLCTSSTITDSRVVMLEILKTLLAINRLILFLKQSAIFANITKYAQICADKLNISSGLVYAFYDGSLEEAAARGLMFVACPAGERRDAIILCGLDGQNLCLINLFFMKFMQFFS